MLVNIMFKCTLSCCVLWENTRIIGGWDPFVNGIEYNPPKSEHFSYKDKTHET